MEGIKVAGRYAQALLELSTDEEKVEEVAKNMKDVVLITNENRDFRNFLKSPLIKVDKKITILHKVFTGFSDVTIKFMELLAKNKREILIPLIAEDFIRRLNEIKGIVPMEFISAYEIDNKVKQNIIDKLSAHIDGEIEITEKVDDSLIGGFTIRMGDMMVDASVTSQLSKMKQRLTR